ncbi:MAG: ABC transporter permease [Thermoleophilia bacterium]
MKEEHPHRGSEDLAFQGSVPPAFEHESAAATGGKPSGWRRWRFPLVEVAVVVIAFITWWVIAYLHVWSPLFVPTPASVWEAGVQVSSRGWSGYLLWEHLWASMRRILIGSGIAIGVGVPLGLLVGTIAIARRITWPGLTFIRALPPLAYFYLLVIWFGIGETPKVLLLVLAALPPIVLATSDAVRNVSQDRLLALETLGASRLQIVRHGVFPSVLPEVITGIRVAVLFAFTTVVAAETINGIPGLGGMARDAQAYNQTDIVIMAIILIGLCGIVLDLAIQIIDRVLVPWRAYL